LIDLAHLMRRAGEAERLAGLPNLLRLNPIAAGRVRGALRAGARRVGVGEIPNAGYLFRDLIRQRVIGRISGDARRTAAAVRATLEEVSIVNRRAIRTSFRRPTLTRVGRLFEGSSVSDFI
jgi:hypothetical protein